MVKRGIVYPILLLLLTITVYGATFEFNRGYQTSPQGFNIIWILVVLLLAFITYWLVYKLLKSNVNVKKIKKKRLS